MVNVDSRTTENPGWANSYGDIQFTYPSYNEVKENLNNYYTVLGKTPKFMAMFGLPDALPQATTINFKEGGWGASSSDMPYAQVDNDQFCEIATGRIVAEDVTYGTLLSSRSVTYDDIIGEPDQWAKNVVSVGGFIADAKAHQNIFSNYNFNVEYQPDYTKVDASKYSVYVHDDHGWPLGFLPYDKACAPILITSSGCNVGNIEATYYGGSMHEYKNFTGVQLSRPGAIGLQAFSNYASGFYGLGRSVFMNSLLDKGSTLGEANLEAINAEVLKYGLKNEVNGMMLYGDPALKIYKQNPIYAPAKITANGNVLTITAPRNFYVNQIPEKSIWTRDNWTHNYQAPGLSGSMCYDEDRYFVASYTTNEAVTTLKQTTNVPSPMGWEGLVTEDNKHYKINYNADGTKTFLWLVRFDEFDGTTGTFKKTLSNINYTLE